MSFTSSFNPASYQPAGINAFGATPQVAPTYTTAAQQGYATTGYDPSYVAPQIAGAQIGSNPSYSATNANAAYINTNPALIDPNQNNAYLQAYEGATATALQPTFQAQQEQLQEQSAARGLTGGAAQYGATQLAGEQAATYASAIQPLISQGYGYTQQDITGNAATTLAGLETNTANRQAVNITNAGAANTAAQYDTGVAEQNAIENAQLAEQTQEANAGYLQSAGQFDTGIQEQNVQTNTANAQQSIGANAGYVQQANLANQGAANTAATQNANYYGDVLAYDANSYNNYLSTLEQQGAGIYDQGYTAYLNSFVPNSGVTSGFNTAVGGTAQAAGSAAAGTASGQAGIFGAAGTVGAAFAP